MQILKICLQFNTNHLNPATACIVKGQFEKRWPENTSFHFVCVSTRYHLWRRDRGSESERTYRAPIQHSVRFGTRARAPVVRGASRRIFARFVTGYETCISRISTQQSRVTTYTKLRKRANYSSLIHCIIRLTQSDKFLRFSIKLFDFSSTSVIMSF